MAGVYPDGTCLPTPETFLDMRYMVGCRCGEPWGVLRGECGGVEDLESMPVLLGLEQFLLYVSWVCGLLSPAEGLDGLELFLGPMPSDFSAAGNSFWLALETPDKW